MWLRKKGREVTTRWIVYPTAESTPTGGKEELSPATVPTKTLQIASSYDEEYPSKNFKPKLTTDPCGLYLRPICPVSKLEQLCNNNKYTIYIYISYTCILYIYVLRIYIYILYVVYVV